MSAEEWHGAIDVRSQLRVMARLWLCYRCYNGAALGWRRLPNGCPACEGSPREQPLTPRKQRLIACGVCRFLGDELTGEPAWYAVEVAEQFADGQSSPAELAQAHRAATARRATRASRPARDRRRRSPRPTRRRCRPASSPAGTAGSTPACATARPRRGRCGTGSTRRPVTARCRGSRRCRARTSAGPASRGRSRD